MAPRRLFEGCAGARDLGRNHGREGSLLVCESGFADQVAQGNRRQDPRLFAQWLLDAYSKGAPVRVISAETTGAKDLYWYVKADSPIKSLKDTDGKILAYSTNGSRSEER